MSQAGNAARRDRSSFAAYLLYGVSVLGVAELFASAAITGSYTPLIWTDILAYVILFLAAILVQREISFSKTIYAILAVVWYVFLVFVLAPKFGHILDWYTIFIQLVMSFLAYVILWFP